MSTHHQFHCFGNQFISHTKRHIQSWGGNHPVSSPTIERQFQPDGATSHGVSQPDTTSSTQSPCSCRAASGKVCTIEYECKCQLYSQQWRCFCLRCFIGRSHVLL
uniref:Uncharacterized protein n=1 Tax=Cacopsylla melanoneura TaxID=428564 RepID=A0A8D9EIB6_9HEMI